jgi:hypothetical protein
MSDDKEPPTNKDEQVEQDERPDNASGLTINPEEVAQEIREQRETIRQLEAERESATRQAAHTSQQLESLKRLVNSMTDEIRQVRQQRDTMEENILDTVSPQDSASQTQGDQAGAQQAVALGAIQSIKDLFPEDQALQQALTAAAERVTQQDEPEENVKVELHTPEQGPFTQRLNNRRRQLAPVRTTLDFGQASTDGDISLNPRGYVTEAKRTRETSTIGTGSSHTEQRHPRRTGVQGTLSTITIAWRHPEDQKDATTGTTRRGRRRGHWKRSLLQCAAEDGAEARDTSAVPFEASRTLPCLQAGFGRVLQDQWPNIGKTEAGNVMAMPKRNSEEVGIRPGPSTTMVL